MGVIKTNDIEWVYPTEYRRYSKDRTIFQLYYNGKWMTTDTTMVK